MSDIPVPGAFSPKTSPLSPLTTPYTEDVPENLRAATSRLQFPASYAIVGVYRLFTDRKLLLPAWKKCEHGFLRGAGVALAWVSCDTGEIGQELRTVV